MPNQAPPRHERPAPVQEMIVVKPGDYGNLYLPLGEGFEAPVRNREIDDDHVRYLAGEGWDEIQGTQAHLLKKGDIFGIFDAHHRIISVDRRGEPGHFLASIYEYGKQILCDDDIRWYFDQFSGRGEAKYKANDRLYSLRKYTDWERLFKAHDVDVAYSVKGWHAYRWAALMFASYNAERLIEEIAQGGTVTDFAPLDVSITSKNQNIADRGLALWTESGIVSRINTTAEALKAWQSVVEYAKKKKHPILASRRILLLVIAIYFTNDHDRCKYLFDRFLTYPFIDRLKDIRNDNDNFGKLSKALLKGLNHKLSARRLKLGAISR